MMQKDRINGLFMDFLHSFSYSNRITIAEATVVQQLINAPSRNRAVFRFRESFFGSFLDKQKRTYN